MSNFRKIEDDEINKVFPHIARGWETQRRQVNCWVSDSDIEGSVPLELEGTFLRNGPGLTDVFGTPLAHPIDGDGMVCALTFFEGKVHFKNRYVQTFSHVEETAAQRMLYNGNMGSRVPGGAENPLKMRDPAHTNAFYWGGKVLACHEYTLPHALDPVTLDTVGVDNLNGDLKKIKALSAHFRYDAENDLLVVIGFRAGIMGRTPKLSVFEYDRKWHAVRQADLTVDGLNYVHDFLVTPKYYIFHITPFVDVREKSVAKTLRGEKFPGELMGFDKDLPSQMVVIERASPQKIYRFETEPCHIYHFQNAIETSADTIVFGATCLPEGFNMEWQHKVFLSNTADAPGVYHNYEIDIAKGTCKRTLSPKIASRSNEFPTSNPYRHSVSLHDNNHKVLPPRFVYLMSSQNGVPLPFTDIVKYDENGDKDDCWHADRGGCIGEPVFIPRYGRASAFYGDDDDGWIITQMYIPVKHQVHYIILDAKNLAAGPICRIKSPVRVPFSFHGTFCPQVFVTPPCKL
mmetsp:Transcript_4346/g.6448  ORF Transcript_4346/g.6448 Transcript_4346/m.6448 type:complete len:516 (+) Transcript_4346:574-2121(+)|eukprot:CAMPEP_0203761822 /NCGR_PEP_ID=MMETSP0098-20131031/14835_1 /ASSEMBLY_ACC=CAM_ASM_000208 /TAXON_ID=96639 /ORGANISM=" , Strain NY0313808BC1" /LENGTH=515 /DNA_ID=CAMNT_0050655977 /DNA_START=111 /DNA_END=1658 /DNA_ORIENTATION=+